MPRAGPLVGRSEELAFLADCVTRAPQHGVVVSGTAGVGKSRLLTQFAESLLADGHTVERVRATRCTSTIPFGVFAHYVGPTAAEPLGRLEALCRLADELARRAEGSKLVLVVDDAHLLDEGSAALVLHLVERGQASILATVRTGDRPPDAVVSLWKEGLVERLELQPLSRPETARLFEAVVGGVVAAEAEDRVWSLTHGNPLYLLELVRVAVAEGVLRQRGDTWRWEGTLHHYARLGELIAERLGSVPDEVRIAVEFVALAEPIPVPTLLELASLEGVRGAEERDLVRSETTDGLGVVRLAHPLYGELLRVAMPETRGIELRRALAARFEEIADEHDVLRIATWRLEAGDQGYPSQFLAAAQRALTSADYDLGERLAAAAVRSGGGAPALTKRAEALYWGGNPAEALEVLARVEQDRDASAADRSLAALLHSSTLFYGLGQPEEAEQVLRRARPRLGDGDEGRLTALQAELAFFNGRITESLELTDAVLATAGTGELARLNALAVATVAWGCQGRVGVACAAADLGLAHALPAADEGVAVVGMLAVARVAALALAGHLDEASDFVALARDVATEQREREAVAPLALLDGRIALYRGDHAAATRLLDEAAERFATHDPVGFAPWCHALRAMAAALGGWCAEAEVAMQAGRSSANPAVRIFDPEIEEAAAWIAASRGELTAARDRARRTAAMAESAGFLVASAQAWHDVARFGHPAEAAPNLARLARQIEGPLVETFARHARALSDANGDALDGAAEAFETLGARFFAAEAAAEAAAAYRSEGKGHSYRRSADRSRLLAESCGNVVSPVLVTAATDSSPLGALTAREREVVDLAARDLSNREIAERLRVSIRTVNNHLNHSYAKLGIAGRSDLADLLQPTRT